MIEYEPVTSDEVKDYISWLAYPTGGPGFFAPCKTVEEKIHIIKHLVRHAVGDNMSKRDKEICMRALDLLNSKVSQPPIGAVS